MERLSRSGWSKPAVSVLARLRLAKSTRTLPEPQGRRFVTRRYELVAARRAGVRGLSHGLADKTTGYGAGSGTLAQPATLLAQGSEHSSDRNATTLGLALTEMTMSQLGVEVPAIPGDVALCGALPRSAVESIAGRFKSWINTNNTDDPIFFPKALKRAGVKHVEVRPFPGPPTMPSDEELAAALEALDSLPRPLMLQCASGTRVGALLLLWLVKKRGYSAVSAKQLAEDSDLKFWRRCTSCGPIRDWLMARLPEGDGTSIMKPARGLSFAQLLDPETWTFTYLLGCEETKEAVLIDPVLEQMRRDLALVEELGLSLRFVLNTHAHADHITSGGMIRKEKPEVRTVIAKAAGAKADILVDPGDRITFGRFSLDVIPTPGHTDGCISLFLPGQPGLVFTGDALLIRGCGRTDFQQGDAATLYESIHSNIFTLPEDTLVYPGHDYKGQNVSTVVEEKRYNPHLTKPKDEFIAVMAGLSLPRPQAMDVAVPSNLEDGV